MMFGDRNQLRSYPFPIAVSDTDNGNEAPGKWSWFGFGTFNIQNSFNRCCLSQSSLSFTNHTYKNINISKETTLLALHIKYFMNTYINFTNNYLQLQDKELISILIIIKE